MEEGKIDQVSNEYIITETLAMLTEAYEVQNAVLLALLHNFDIKIPEWKNQEEIKSDVGDKIEACIKALRKANNGPGETNQG